MVKRYKQNSFIITKTQGFLFKALAAAFVSSPVLFTPTKMDAIDFRFVPSPLEISIDRASPAYSALEDSRVAFLESRTSMDGAHIVETKVAPTRLIAGEKFSEQTEQRQLSGMTLARVVGPYEAAPQERQIELQVAPRLRPRLEVARAYLREQQSPPPTFQETAKMLVAEELERRQEVQPGVREIRTTAGSSIYVGRVNAPTNLPRLKSPSTKPVQLAKNDHPAKPRVPVRREIEMSALPTGPAITGGGGFSSMSNAAATFDPSSAKGTVISGSLKFAGGAAFAPGQDQIYIYQEYDQLLLKEGSVSAKDGFYRIDIEKLQGELVAEARSPEGALTAQARISLGTALISHDPKGKISDLDLVLTPAFDEVAVRVISGTNRASLMGEGTNVQIEGIRRLAYNKKELAYKDEGIVRPSTFLVKADAPDAVPGISLAGSGSLSWMNLYPKQFFDKVMRYLDLTFDRKSDGRFGTIFGRAYFEGQPMAGALVDLLSQENEKVVYLDGQTPKLDWQSTGPSGSFLIPYLEPGLDVLKVQQIGTDIMPILVAVEKDHVADVTIQVGGYREIEFNVFNGVTGELVPAYINIVGTPDVIETDVNGLALVNRRRVTGTSLAEVDPGEGYVVSRVALNDKAVLAKVPVFTENWLAAVTNKATRVAPEHRNRLAIGYVQGDNYEVVLADAQYSVEPQVIYFNPDGSVREEPWGVSDGGYMIIGLDAGLQTITIIPEKSKNVITRNLVIDDRAVDTSIINLQF